MKLHSTNYTDTFIEIAEDSPTALGETPPTKGGEKSVANLQFEMIKQHPYQYSSDEVVFYCYATKKNLTQSELPAINSNFSICVMVYAPTVAFCQG